MDTGPKYYSADRCPERNIDWTVLQRNKTEEGPDRQRLMTDLQEL